MKFFRLTGSTLLLLFVSLLPFQHKLKPVTPDTQWTPIILRFHRVEMALVPAGCFTMGSNEDHMERLIADCETVSSISGCRSAWLAVESPAHEICFDEPFFIDRYEASNAQVERFGGQLGYNPLSPRLHCPYGGASWYMAQEYCARRGMRLPTEAEWEYAARGPQNPIYTWGNEYIDAQEEICPARPDSVPPADDSWVGAKRMSLGMWEWVSTLFRQYPYDSHDGREDPHNTVNQRVLRGGAFQYVPLNVRHAAYRLAALPQAAGNLWGVRCAAP